MMDVLSERAEASVDLIFQTLGGHKTTMAAMPGTMPSGRLASSPNLEMKQIQRQATLLRLVSITESFCASRLLSRSEESLPRDGGPLLSIIWEEAALDATRTWESQKEAFKKWLGAKPNWANLDGLAEARNAIAHGLGTLTRRQVKSHQSTMTKLSRTGISVTNDRLTLTEDDLSRAAVMCRELIAEVDFLTR